MELKRIPKCASLVVGHNGFGEFSIWYVFLFFSPHTPPRTCTEGSQIRQLEDHEYVILEGIFCL